MTVHAKSDPEALLQPCADCFSPVTLHSRFSQCLHQAAAGAGCKQVPLILGPAALQLIWTLSSPASHRLGTRTCLLTAASLPWSSQSTPHSLSRYSGTSGSQSEPQPCPPLRSSPAILDDFCSGVCTCDLPLYWFPEKSAAHGPDTANACASSSSSGTPTGPCTSVSS